MLKTNFQRWTYAVLLCPLQENIYVGLHIAYHVVWMYHAEMSQYTMVHESEYRLEGLLLLNWYVINFRKHPKNWNLRCGIEITHALLKLFFWTSVFSDLGRFQNSLFTEFSDKFQNLPLSNKICSFCDCWSKSRQFLHQIFALCKYVKFSVMCSLILYKWSLWQCRTPYKGTQKHHSLLR